VKGAKKRALVLFLGKQGAINEFFLFSRFGWSCERGA